MSIDKLLRAPDGEAEIRAFYGWRDEFLLPNGSVSPEWERDFMRSAVLPAPLKFIGKPVLSVHVHRLLVDRFESVYNEIFAAGLWQMVEPYGGGYAFRLVRGGDTLSLHAFGAAVDHDPQRNPLGVDPFRCSFGSTDAGCAVVRIFEKHQFLWGGRFSGRKDSQHFQFGTGC